MRFSLFTKVYEICDSNNVFWYLIRHSILNYSFLLIEKEFERLMGSLSLSKLPEDFLDLKKSHLIVPETYSEERFVSTLIEESKIDQPFFNIFYLTFDTECNLNCKYCYTEGSVDCDFKPQKMNKDTLSKTFEFLRQFISQGRGNYIGDKISFIFYGSEPLMHKDLFVEALEMMDDLATKEEIEINKQLITNATLVNEEMAKIFKKYDVNVAISLDGPKEIHDKMRIYHDGSGSFFSVLKGIEILRKNDISFNVSCTIGPHNIYSLSKCIDFFKEISVDSIGFNLLLDAKFKKIPNISNFSANNALFNSFRNLEKAGFFESRVGRKLKPFNTPGKIHFKDCGAYGNQLVFFPNGDIGVCQGYLGYRKNILGNVKESSPEEIFSSSVLNDWVSRIPLNRSECRFCPALGICGGGCLFNSECRTGNIFSRNKAFCMHTLMSLDWLIMGSLKQKLGNNIYVKDISFMK